MAHLKCCPESEKLKLNLPEENLGSNIAVLLGLFPGLADDAALVSAQQSGAALISRDGGHGCGDSGGGGTGLHKLIDIKNYVRHRNTVKIRNKIKNLQHKRWPKPRR